jgi:hypothetical protein
MYLLIDLGTVLLDMPLFQSFRRVRTERAASSITFLLVFAFLHATFDLLQYQKARFVGVYLPRPSGMMNSPTSFKELTPYLVRISSWTKSRSSSVRNIPSPSSIVFIDSYLPNRNGIT